MGFKINLNKKNAWKILKPLGFRKKRGLRWNYEKQIGSSKRIHIKWQKGGFYEHIDNH